MTDHTMRGDMIELYKLFNGGYDNQILRNLLKTKEKSLVRHSRERAWFYAPNPNI